MKENSVKDIKFTDDLDILNGDFALEESEEVHVENIIRANKGYFFETPLLGVGIIKELNGQASSQDLKQNIRRQLILDDYNVKSITIKDGEINIDANRIING